MCIVVPLRAQMLVKEPGEKLIKEKVP